MQIVSMIKGRNKQIKPKIRDEPKHKKSISIFAAFLILGILLQIKELNQDTISEAGELERKEAGAGESIEHLKLTIPELAEEEDYTVTVPEQILSESEREELFTRAERELEERFCGENESVDRITQAVVLPKSFADGLVSADWRFDDYEIMNPDGTINEEAVPAEGAVVMAEAELTYASYRRLYEFPFCVYPRELSSRERVYRELDSYFSEESGRSGMSKVTLPQEAGGFRLIWTAKHEKTGLLFIGLGALAAVLSELSAKQRTAEQKKERERLLMCDYPEMVNKLSLLLGAGMTVTNAWERIVALYEKQRSEGIVGVRPAYEEMRLTAREIRDGVGERAAYERFGERCGLRPYRKLSSLIVQNLRKGSKGMTALMAAEADEAFELRKNLAKKLGEEAGTKLLAPMMLMLGIIVVIIMVPAFLSFQ